MPTPIGHTLAGFAASTFLPQKDKRTPIYLLFIALFMANAPDLDFIPGVLVGKPSLYHSTFSHSLGFGLLVSAVVAGLVWLWKRSFTPAFIYGFTAYASHLVLDFFNADGRSPYGVPFFWPLSSQYFISPQPVFAGVVHSGTGLYSTLDYLLILFGPHNLRAMLLEAAILAPFVLFGLFVQRMRSRQSSRSNDGTVTGEPGVSKG